MRATLGVHVSIATVLGGLVAAGCGGSGSRGGGSVAAPVQSATQGGTSSQGVNLHPQAPASQGDALTVYNAEWQEVWDALRPGVIAQLDQVLAQQLNRQLFRQGSLEVEVVNAKLAPSSDLLVAPGALVLDADRFVFRAPLSGTWQVGLAADLRVTLNVGSLAPALNVPVEVWLDDLSLEVDAEIDDSDPARPVVRRVGQPQLAFSLRIDSPNPIAQQLTGVLSGPANWLAQQALTVTLYAFLPQLQGLQGLPGSVPAAGAPPLVDSGTQVPFEEVVQNVELKLRAVNQPHGLVLTAIVDTPATDTWLAAYRNGGPGVQGTVVDYEDGGDSAIWTGQYLAAQSFRYAATGSALAQDSIGHTLKGIGALLDVNGGTGLLARTAAPETSLAGQQIASRGAFRSAQLHGETWIGWQGTNGISRDQYSGVVFGLSAAYEHVPAARPEAKRRLEQILDYLIAERWIVDEDRPGFGSVNSRGPTFWAGVGAQKLAFLHAGYRVNPQRYGAALAAAGPLSKLAWLGSWFGTFGLDHYYGFNLGHINNYTYFQLETDASRWQDMRRAFSLVERYVGHHRNAHFDLIRTTIDPSTQGVLHGSVREAMRQFVETNHRVVAPAVIDLSGVTWTTHTQVEYTHQGGMVTLVRTTKTLPSEPLHPALRQPYKHFVWQREPFTPATPNQGDPRREKIGLDLVLPYWMGRQLGVF